MNTPSGAPASPDKEPWFPVNGSEARIVINRRESKIGDLQRGMRGQMILSLDRSQVVELVVVPREGERDEE